jgi:hypothetical protein
MDQATGTPLKTGGELGCSERVTISCSKSGTRGVNLVTNPLISESHEWGKNREALTSPVYKFWHSPNGLEWLASPVYKL